MIASLLWKEWRECRWKMLVLFAVYLLLVLLAWAVERHYPLQESQFAVLALTFVMPGVVAMGTIADERVRRTADTLQALPVSMGRVFAVKSLAGLATLLVPLLAVEAFCWLVLPALRESADFAHDHPFWILSLIGLTVALYVWILALGARLRTELSVGLAYVLMLFSCAAVAILFETLRGLILRNTGDEFNPRAWASLLYYLSPVGFVQDVTAPTHTDGVHIAITAVLQAFTWLTLWEIALWRFITTPATRVARPLASNMAPSKTPLASRRFPVLWKSWRESRHVVLACATVTLVFIAIDSLLIQSALTRGWYFTEGPAFLVIAPGILGMVMVIFLGTDVGMRESEIHLESFWQSRPIPQASYFLRRFAFGLLLALLLVAVPAALSLGITTWQLATTQPPPDELFRIPYPIIPDWPPSREPGVVSIMLDHLSDAQGAARVFLGFFVPQAMLFFATAAFIATLSRRRIIPLFVSFGFAVAFQMLYANDHFGNYLNYHWYGDWHSWLALGLAYFMVMLALSALMAWLAVTSTTRNWRASLERGLENREEAVAS